MLDTSRIIIILHAYSLNGTPLRTAAAAMASEPSPESIQSVAAVTGLLLGEASRWLKVQLLLPELVRAASVADDYSYM